MRDEDERVSTRNCIRHLFQNCDFPEELSEAFDAEVVLNDDAVGGRSPLRYSIVGLVCFR